MLWEQCTKALGHIGAGSWVVHVSAQQRLLHVSRMRTTCPVSYIHTSLGRKPQHQAPARKAVPLGGQPPFTTLSPHPSHSGHSDVKWVVKGCVKGVTPFTPHTLHL